MIKAFLIEFSSFKLQESLPTYLKKNTIDVQCWSCCDNDTNFITSAFPNATIVNQRNAFGLESFHCLPMAPKIPGEKIFESMRHAYLEFAEQCGRRNFTRMTNRKILRLYNRIIVFWYTLFTHYKPDVVFFSCHPHMGYDIVVYYMAKLLQINTILLYETDFIGHTFFGTEIVVEKPFFPLDYAQGISSFEDITSEEIRKCFIGYTDTTKKQRPVYAYRDFTLSFQAWYPKKYNNLEGWRANFATNTKLLKLLRLCTQPFSNDVPPYILDSLESKSVILSVFFLVYAKLRQKLGIQQYNRIARQPDFKQKFIYFSLSSEPEASINPSGSIYNDVVITLETLSSALPDGWKIYVKEHPYQHSVRSAPNYPMFRGDDFYTRINSIPHVQLVPMDVCSFTLLDAAQAVGTHAGSVGLEAIFRKKKALLFGNTWYKFFPGTYAVASVEDCKNALAEPDLTKSPDFEQRLFTAIASLEHFAYKGTYEPQFLFSSQISPEENSRLLAESMFCYYSTLSKKE